jgi:hypothetical protein
MTTNAGPLTIAPSERWPPSPRKPYEGSHVPSLKKSTEKFCLSSEAIFKCHVDASLMALLALATAIAPLSNTHFATFFASVNEFPRLGHFSQPLS